MLSQAIHDAVQFGKLSFTKSKHGPDIFIDFEPNVFNSDEKSTANIYSIGITANVFYGDLESDICTEIRHLLHRAGCELD